jgi:hypothetical protein
MSVMVKKYFGLAVVLVAACAQMVNAQVSTSSVPFLLIAPNSRAGGMGEAGAALADDASALYWNPGGLAFQQGQEVSISHANWLPAFNLPDLYIDYLVYRMPLPQLDGNIAASITFLNLGSFTRTQNDPTPLATFNAYEFGITLGYSTKLSEELGIGINGRFIHSRLAPFGTAEEQGTPLALGKFRENFAFLDERRVLPGQDLHRDRLAAEPGVLDDDAGRAGAHREAHERRRPRALAGVDFLPHVKHGDERNEPKHRPRQEVEPVGQIVLNADIDDMPVLLHLAACGLERNARPAGWKETNKAGLFRAAGIVNYRICDHEQYQYPTTGINAYYRAILSESLRGWPGGLRWLFREDAGV